MYVNASLTSQRKWNCLGRRPQNQCGKNCANWYILTLKSSLVHDEVRFLSKQQRPKKSFRSSRLQGSWRMELPRPAFKFVFWLSSFHPLSPSLELTNTYDPGTRQHNVTSRPFVQSRRNTQDLDRRALCNCKYWSHVSVAVLQTVGPSPPAWRLNLTAKPWSKTHAALITRLCRKSKISST